MVLSNMRIPRLLLYLGHHPGVKDMHHRGCAGHEGNVAGRDPQAEGARVLDPKTCLALVNGLCLAPESLLVAQPPAHPKQPPNKLVCILRRSWVFKLS